MTASVVYPLLRAHDPDGTRLRTLPVTLAVGDALLPATTLVPVTTASDSVAGDAEIVDGDFTVEVLSIGLIAATADGDIWGVNFKLRGGLSRLGERDPYPLIRLRVWLASQPDEPAYDQTYQVEIRQL